MGPISITAEAGLDILRKLASGELEIHGILIRDTDGKKFRYILRGLENLPRDAARLNELPPLEPLRVALNATQILQAITVAQNAAVAASLRRIEAKLDAIETRLSGIEVRIGRIEAKQTLVLEALRTAPVSRLKAAKTAAVVALQHGDKTAKIAAGKDAQQAAHDLLEQARHLVRVEEDGLPVAILLPVEHADLAESAAEATLLASAIWLALDNKNAAMGIIRETSDALQAMRRNLAAALADPELLLRRMKADQGRDADLLATGKRLREVIFGLEGRAVLIDQGLISGDTACVEFERAEPVAGLSFLPIVEFVAESASAD